MRLSQRGWDLPEPDLISKEKARWAVSRRVNSKR